MPFALIVVGLLMIVTGARGTYKEFGAQVASDFTGPGNFLYWIAGIGAVGALGYIDSLRTFSRLFMALILISMVLSNRGFFAKLQEALKSGPIPPPAPQPSAATSSEYNAGLPPVNSTDAGALLSDRQAEARDKAAAAKKASEPNTLWDILQSINPFASRPAY